MEPTTIYEAMGGAEVVLALAEAWHRRCLADPILAHPFEHGVHPQHTERLIASEGRASGGNTTLTAVITDAPLDGRSLGQLARQVHTSMGRAIQPFHTSTDGDVLWALSTRASSVAVSGDVLAWRASEVAWDAVLSIPEGVGTAS